MSFYVVGELVTGPQVTMGYLNEPKKQQIDFWIKYHYCHLHTNTILQ